MLIPYKVNISEGQIEAVKDSFDSRKGSFLAFQKVASGANMNCY